jgi:ureidoacrylate peracid hydrolase
MHKTSLPQFAIERGRMMHPPKPLVPAQTAVLAIDFQRFFIDDGQPMGNPHARDILDDANRLHAAVRNAGGLVIFTQHSIGRPGQGATAEASSTLSLLPGSSSYELHPKITCAEGEVMIVKHQSSPLHPKSSTQLVDLLQKRGITTLIITGLVTNGCCDCTARDAFQHGFDVVVASNGTAAMTDEEHNAALLNLEIYYARVMTTTEIEAAL